MTKQDLHNEREILLQVAAGNEAAFQKVFDHYKGNIYTTVLRMTGSAQVAEEILQDTLLKVWLKRESLPEIQHFTAWVLTIAENLTYNAIKSMEREKARGQALRQWAMIQHFPEIPEELIHKEYDNLLRKAVVLLPPRQQQTYRLIKEQGLKREEAATALKISPETVKWNLDQAMRSIRAYCLAHLQELSVAAILFFF